MADERHDHRSGQTETHRGVGAVGTVGDQSAWDKDQEKRNREAEAKHKESVKKNYERDKALDAKTRAEGAEKLSKGKPTPTQEENDLAAQGEHITEHEDDGSGPDPYPSATVTANKAMEESSSSRSKGYQTK
jgi:hypothetical protein